MLTRYHKCDDLCTQIEHRFEIIYLDSTWYDVDMTIYFINIVQI